MENKDFVINELLQALQDSLQYVNPMAPEVEIEHESMSDYYLALAELLMKQERLVYKIKMILDNADNLEEYFGFKSPRA